MSRDDILALLELNRETLLRYSVRRLGLFGSFVRNAAGESSDLDFLVELEHKTFDNYMDLKFFLENLLGRRVDLVLADSLKPRLREPILREVVHVQGF